MSTLVLVAGLTFIAMLVAVAAMAVGAAITGRRLRGSCGGVGPGSSDCLCDREGRPRRCEAPAEPPLVEMPRGR